MGERDCLFSHSLSALIKMSTFNLVCMTCFWNKFMCTNSQMNKKKYFSLWVQIIQGPEKDMP